jgi:hypothetical protein
MLLGPSAWAIGEGKVQLPDGLVGGPDGLGAMSAKIVRGGLHVGARVPQCGDRGGNPRVKLALSLRGKGPHSGAEQRPIAIPDKNLFIRSLLLDYVRASAGLVSGMFRFCARRAGACLFGR